MNRNIALFVFVICSPLAVASIALNQQKDGVCATLDWDAPVTVAQWLQGWFIAGLVVAYIMCICLFFMRNNIFFGINWSIIGVFVIIHSNIECIREGVTNTSFALAAWCISAFVICVHIVNLLPK